VLKIKVTFATNVSKRFQDLVLNVLDAVVKTLLGYIAQVAGKRICPIGF
jgi:hypothetical protein